MKNNEFIKKVFKDFSEYKTDSDYWLEIDGNRILTQQAMFMFPDNCIISSNEREIICKRSVIELLSPNNIDSREFWKEAIDKFPLLSISSMEVKTIAESEKQTLDMAATLGLTYAVGQEINDDKSKLFLEIGPGYGGFHQIYKESYGDNNYYAIDVNPLFEHPRLFQTDGKTIPDTIPYGLDIVYSMNVFQHLSKAQRTSYYRQIYMALKTGGSFFFGMFIKTKLNSEWPVWGLQDEHGRCYVNFFRQLTEIDTEEELMEELTGLAYIVEKISRHEDKSHYLTFKCTTT